MERRVVTILAVDMVGSTAHVASADPEDAEAFLDECLSSLSALVDQEGGRFISFSGDGGIVVFGWPNALETHADQACQAAIRIQRWAASDTLTSPAARPVQYRIGVHSGLLGFRRLSVGGETKSDVVGGVVYLASALQKSGGAGEVFVSSETLELCRNTFAVDEQIAPEAIQAAGLRAFRIGEGAEQTATDAAAQGLESLLVGRKKETRLLDDLLSMPPSIAPALGLVGEPGIGKSRLANYLKERASAGSQRTVVYNSHSLKRATPFAMIRDLLGRGSAMEMGKLAGLATNPDEALKALQAIQPYDDGSNHRRGPVALRQIALPLVDLLYRTILSDVAVVIVEDFHHLDSESRHCLKLIAAQASERGLKLVVTARTEAVDDLKSVVSRIVPVEALSENAMGVLSNRLASVEGDAAHLIAAATTSAKGNPFLLEQIFKAYAKAPLAGEPELPRGVESMIHAQLNWLSESARVTAQKLSLLGYETEAGVARKIVGLDQSQWEQDLADLVSLAFLERPSGDIIRFRHALIADACATTLSRYNQIALHSSALDILVEQDAGLERLAYHAMGARDDDRALDFLTQAVRRAVRSAATRSLEISFNKAVDCARRLGEVGERRLMQVVLIAASSMQQVGRIEEMKNLLRDIMPIAERDGNPLKACGALCQLGNICWFEGDYPTGYDATLRALSIAVEAASLPHVFAAQFMHGNMLFGLGRLEEAISVQRQLSERLSGDLELSRLGAAIIPASQAKTQIGWFQKYTGEHKESLSHTLYSVGIAERAGDPFTEVLARVGAGHSLLALGRDEDAIEMVGVAHKLAIDIGYDAALPHAVGVLSLALARAGRTDDALTRLEDWMGMERWKRTGKLELFYIQLAHAEALWRSHRISEGVAAINEGLAVAESIGNPALRIEGLTTKAHILETFDQTDPRVTETRAERDELGRTYDLFTWS